MAAGLPDPPHFYADPDPAANADADSCSEGMPQEQIRFHSYVCFKMKNNILESSEGQFCGTVAIFYGSGSDF
jgi:hypothetical protein